MKKLIYFVIINFFLLSKSFALIEVDITRGNLDPLPIAISPLHVDIKSEDYDGIKIKVLGEDISKIIEDNFRSTGLFNPLKKDGTIMKSEILDHQRMNRPGQKFYKVLAESALRAVRLCQPLKVPPTGYDKWKELQLNFNPTEMLRG